MTTRKQIIGTMLAGFPGQSNITAATVMAYLLAVEHCSDEAIASACMAYLRHQVADHDYQFAPTAAQLGHTASMFEPREADPDLGDLIAYPIGADVPEGAVPLGPTSVDFGYGRIDMSRMSHAEKEETMRTKRLPGWASRPRIKRISA